MSKIISWLSVWWLYYFTLNFVFIPNGFSNRHGQFVNTLLTLTFCFLAIHFFKLKITKRNLLIAFTVYIGGLFILNKLFLPLHTYINGNDLKFVLRNDSPIFPLATQIIFQQIMIFILVKKVFSKTNHSILFSSLFFMFSHFPIFLIARLAMWEKLWIAGMSFIAGLIFSFIIHKFKKGYIASFLIHFTYYFFLALLTESTNQFIP